MPAYTEMAARLTEEDRNAYCATGKAISFLMKMEHDGSCGLEKSSVYGSAVAVPQIARSAGWSGTMLALTIRSYVFLLLNLIIQLFLLFFIGEEVHVMNGFAGQMHLCDFGKNMEQCPGGQDCVGPGGTIYAPSRLYGFDIWLTRTFVRDSLKAAFPHRSQEFDQLVDPGEYGMENWWCRFICCFVFMMSVMDDLRNSLNLILLLWNLPNKPQKWISYEPPDWAGKDQVKKIHNWSELNLVKFGVAGMPRAWKVANLFTVCFPKLVIWYLLTSSGFHLLMESAGILDVIMNSLAVNFILSIDEIIFQVLTTIPVRHMMTNLEDYDLFKTDEEEKETDDEILYKFQRTELGRGKWRVFATMIIPRRLFQVIVLMLIFWKKYYYYNCMQMEDGSWVSKPLYVPPDTSFRPLAFLFNYDDHASDSPAWVMPERDG